MITTVCSLCFGTRHINNDPCALCNGDGFEKKYLNAEFDEYYKNNNNINLTE
jgi:DnaJ-class molecular chaperone